MRLTHRIRLHSFPQKKNEEGTTTTTTTAEPWQDEDAGAGVVGAQFFGGNKEKEEFYDPVAEARATLVVSTATVTTFDRFADRTAFDSDAVAQLAAAYQQALHPYNGTTNNNTNTNTVLSPNVQWTSPFSASQSSSSSSLSPLQALRQATQFYRRLHVAITAGQTQADGTYTLRWEMGLAWPTFWEPAVLLTGTSSLSTDEEGIITKQVDRLDDPDLLGCLARQILPRFWDVYHIGMTPTSELSPAWERREQQQGQGLFTNLVVYDVPARWMWAPALLDQGDRDNANAAFLPNHAFTTAIRTMGPTKDRYVPTSPTQIDIAPGTAGNTVTWKIPLSVQLQSQTTWPLLPNEGEDNQAARSATTTHPTGTYVFTPARRVATLPTGLARAQDEGVTDLRKRLYETVTAAGLRPKRDANGRPCFFFWSATTKTCWTDKGLGMAVYEWRPAWAQANHIGLELLETPESSSLPQSTKD